MRKDRRFLSAFGSIAIKGSPFTKEHAMRKYRQFLSAFGSIAIILVGFGAGPIMGASRENPPEALDLMQRFGDAFAVAVKEGQTDLVAIRSEVSVNTANPTSDFMNGTFLVFYGVLPTSDEQPTQRRGSGMIVSQDGYILTNNRVVDDANRIRVKLFDGRSLNAEVVGTDATRDLAVLKVQAQNLPVAQLDNSESLQAGGSALACEKSCGCGGDLQE